MFTLLSFKPYRWTKAVFGARSFIKESTSGRATTYALISGNSDTLNDFASDIINMGYTEEWPKNG